MSPRNKHFAVSLMLAILLHIGLLFGIEQRMLLAPLKPLKPPPIAYLVSRPRQPETEPEKPDALAEENRHATQVAETKAKTPPNVPPPSLSDMLPDIVSESVAIIRAEPKQIALEPEPKQMALEPEPKQMALEPEPKQATLEAEPKQATPETKPKRVPLKTEPKRITIGPESIRAKSEAKTAQTQKPLVTPTPLIRPTRMAKSHSEPEFNKEHSPTPFSANPAIQQEHNLKTPQTQEASLDLMPSMENLSLWDRQRRYQSRFGAQSEETVSLNTRKVRYASYFSRLKQRVEQGWVYPSQAKKDKLFGNVSMVFTIRRDGHLLRVEVLRSSGATILDESAVRAVKNAAPFPPFPEDWSLERLHIRATFEYIRRKLKWRD